MPYKAITWKEHKTYEHAYEDVKENGSNCRGAEEGTEHCMKIVHEAEVFSRNVRGSDQRMDIKIKRVNLGTSSLGDRSIKKRKTCKICGNFLSKRVSPYCRCKFKPSFCNKCGKRKDEQQRTQSRFCKCDLMPIETSNS